MRALCIYTLILGLSMSLLAQTAKEYPDGHGGSVLFPLGDISFADKVVSFEIGDPHAAELNSQPKGALGIPDYVATGDDSYLTLGCSGVLTLRFEDNALMDIEGPDLYVFEIGPAVEAMDLAISADGEQWFDVGRISGGRADVDIAPHTTPGTVFHYVRLRDLKAACSGRWPGADVDAVGAIGAAIQFSLNGSVLFDTGKRALKPAARSELESLAEQIATYGSGSILIEGHTDSVGSSADNLTLSSERASAVVEYLAGLSQLGSFSFDSKGYGESRPTATNDTDEGRAANRRVDIVLTPGPQ